MPIVISGSFVQNSPCSCHHSRSTFVGLFVPNFGNLHFQCTCHRQGKCHTSSGPQWVGIAECSEDFSFCTLASWADCVPMIARRHLVIVAQMIRSMELGPTIPSLLSLGDVARTILDVGGVEVPSWPALVDGVRPPPRDPEAAFRVEQQFREQQLLLVLSESERALLCSQSGLGAGSFLTVPPTNPLVRFDSQIFQVLLLRRLRLPLPCQAFLPMWPSH